MGARRIFLSAIAAAAVTFGLFLLMHRLVFPESANRAQPAVPPVIRFGAVEIPEGIAVKSRSIPVKPEPPREPPPLPRLRIPRAGPLARQLPRLDIPELDVPLVGGAGVELSLGNYLRAGPRADGDVIPIVRIPPRYPRDAAMAQIEGWVKVEFTITEAGTVEDARVVESDPPRVFDRAALRAIARWKFKPRIIAGVAVERRATQTIDFTLEE